mmetsp:Transcript_14092/g.33795  ORF Transcript_14092/g.33795 Transcript_14092/m.33795 type:complete len:203 (+) Transcript_14092:805-1413(+)
MYLRAMISCPWPMETPRILIFLRLASSSMSLVGSAPGDSRQMKGTHGVDSFSAFSMLSGTDSVKRCPMASAMYSCAATMVRSSRRLLTTHMRSNLLIFSSKSGTLLCSGASRSYHCRHSPSLRLNESSRSWNTGTWDSATRSSQHLSGIQSLGFLRTLLMSRLPPPLRNTPTRDLSRLLALIRILLVSISANVSLWRSNSPR